MGRFLDDVCIHNRIRSSLRYLTPAEYEAQLQQVDTLVLDSGPTTAGKVSSFWGSLQSRQPG